jgi:hypothetical protein
LEAAGKGMPSKVRMENQTLQSNSSYELPKDHEDILREAETNQKILSMYDKFYSHMDKLHHKTILLENPEQKKLYAKRAFDDSRYSSKGKQKIKTEMRRRLKYYPASCAWLVTLTIADKYQPSGAYRGMTQLEAWKKVGPCVADFMDEWNKLRARRGFKKRLIYFKVPEVQPGRNYPHIHILIPGLRVIGDFKEIQNLWPYGNADFKYVDQASPANYITKYISKMDGDDFANLMLYTYHLRMFSMAKGFKYPLKDKNKNDFKFFMAITHASIEKYLYKIMKAGYEQEIERLTEPRGP